MREEPYNAKVVVSPSRFFRAIRNDEEDLLQLMYESGDAFTYVSEEGRNALAYCAITNNRKVFMFFKDNLDLSEEIYLECQDVYGKKAEYYIKERGWKIDE